MLSLVDPDATAGPLIPGMGQIPSGPMLTNQEEGKLIQSYQGSKTFVSKSYSVPQIQIMHILKDVLNLYLYLLNLIIETCTQWSTD